jgi:UDP-arabinose 4-epimerase
MKRILVTGGAGYIGSHTCKLLASYGYEPICYDNLSTGHAGFVKWGPFELGDLHDFERLKKVLKTYEPLAVIHFAASAYVEESVTNPIKYYQNNVCGTLSLLAAMRQVAADIIVFSSSCATYGIPEVQFITESYPQLPINPYGQSKLMVERILKDLSACGEIRYMSLRYFNAAGADRDGEIGEKHDPETHLIPLAIRSAIHQTPLNVFGTDFPTLDGTAIRDYIDVEDLARAHLLAVEYLLEDGKSDCINLGTGKGNSVKEIITTLKDLGLNVNDKPAARRACDPACLVADTTKAKTLLGWQTEYINIKDILATAVNWHRHNG